MSDVRHCVVIGGGITGLTAAHRLLRSSQPLRVTLLEADRRLGGHVRTEAFAGRCVDVGAEALLARVPEAAAICRELGLGERLVAPATDRPYVWTGGRLRPLPPGLLTGLPDGAGVLVRSRILSPAGLARAGLDLVVPSRPVRSDIAIGSLVRRRLGHEVHDRLVDPLLGGIHAGSCDDLSLRAVAPMLTQASGSGRGLVRGLRRLGARSPGSPIFLGLVGGLGELVTALADAIGEGGARADGGSAELRRGAAVEGLEPLDAGRVRIVLVGGEQEIADAVLLATPAFDTARIVQDASPATAAWLRRIDYASVGTILLEYPLAALPGPLAGSGFLVPRAEGRTLTACTWSSAKWAHLSGATALLKASVGNARDASALEFDDDRLIARVHGELSEAMGLRGEPLQAAVWRFERALPQYRVGHLERVAAIEDQLSRLGAIRATGAALRGVGVASCIRAAQAAADELAGHLSAARERAPTIAT